MTAVSVSLPEWAWEFHGHRCPLMPLGYRMGLAAMKELGVGRERDHGTLALSEMGEGHPNTCMNDGIQAATGCTYGKLLMDRLNYGKLAFVLYRPGVGAVRVSVKPELVDAISAREFSRLRKAGTEPSEIPPQVADVVVGLVMDAAERDLFTVERLPDFEYERPQARFSKAKCSKCGEYVFERYVRMVDGKPFCIPCSGYTESRSGVPKGGL